MTAYLFTGEVSSFVVPASAPEDVAVASNFERFDGLDQPALDHPAGALWIDGSPELRPGGGGTALAEQTYTPGPLSGLTNTLGGQPLPVSATGVLGPSLVRGSGYTPAGYKLIGGPKRGSQWYQGIAQTVALSEITSNPPQPGDITSIIAGVG